MENPTFGDPINTFGNTPRDDGVLNKTTAGVHAAANSVGDAAENAARRVKPAIDQVATMAHHFVDRAAASAAPAVDWLGEQSESLNAKQKKLVTDTSACIAANPLLSVGMGVVAGFVLSRLFRR